MARSASARAAWLGGASVTVLGVLFLAAWSIVLVRLGPADARAYLVIRGLVSLAGALVPVSAPRWVKAHPTVVATFARRVAVMLELVIAAASTIALVATAPWWAPRAGIAAPAPWMIAAACLHLGAARTSRAIIKLGVEPAGAFLAALAMLGQLAATPLAALIHGSASFVIGASALASLGLGALALRVPPRSTSEVSRPRSLVHVPAWLHELAQALPRIVVALALAGAPVVPFESAMMLGGLLFMPFLVAALPEVSGLARKLARGLVLALACYALLATAGPWLYAALYPRWFGGAHLMRSYAWNAVALVPLSYYRKRKGEPDWRTAVTSLVGIAAMVVLAPMRGVVGVIQASAAKLTVAAVLGIADPTRREEQLLG